LQKLDNIKPNIADLWKAVQVEYFGLK